MNLCIADLHGLPESRVLTEPTDRDQRPEDTAIGLSVVPPPARPPRANFIVTTLMTAAVGIGPGADPSQRTLRC